MSPENRLRIDATLETSFRLKNSFSCSSLVEVFRAHFGRFVPKLSGFHDQLFTDQFLNLWPAYGALWAGRRGPQTEEAGKARFDPDEHP